MPTHSQVQVPYLPLTMDPVDPFPSKKKNLAAGKVQYLRYAQMLGHVFFKLLDVPKTKLVAIIGEGFFFSYHLVGPGFCTYILYYNGGGICQIF